MSASKDIAPSDAERFWAKVSRGGADDCWVWNASRNPHGYGYFWDSRVRRMVFAHRFSFELQNGPIPPNPPGRRGASGVIVRHSCDNPSCVNPAHLNDGTQLDNMADKTARGRHPDYAGHRNPNAKLTPEQVAEIRERYTGKWGEQSALGREYGVYGSTIRDIVQNRKWKPE